jgi:DNA-binding NarL/FixJ family response regulator
VSTQGPSLRPASNPVDILVIDDDELFGLSLLDRLKNERWSIAFHQGPFGTVNAIRAAQPKLLILDLNMPGLEGTRIHELLKKRNDLTRTKVLLLSSTDAKELTRIANDNGFDGALHKSASRNELVEAIKLLLS